MSPGQPQPAPHEPDGQEAVQRQDFSTSDPGVAEDAVSSAYHLDFHLGRLTGALDMSLQALSVGPPGGQLVSAHASYGVSAAATSTTTSPLPSFTTVILLAGGLQQASHHDQRRQLQPGQVMPFNTEAGTHVRFSSEARFGSLQLPMRLVQQAALARSDIPAHRLRFFGLAPVDGAAERYWAHLMATTHAQLHSAESPLSHPLLRQHWLEVLAGAALRVFPNTTMTGAADHGHPAGAVGPATVRRAVAFAEANAHLPVGVEQMAQAAGIGVRALQLAFGRHLDTTPSAYLRMLRLAGARTELEHAGPGAGTTVADIAARWGFTSSRAFASAYRRAYAEAPSTTLRW